MKTILIEWKSGLRQVHTDTTENLLDLLVMEIDHIEEVEYVDHIDKRNKVKQVREALALTQQQFADKIGVSATTIIRWENNNRSFRSNHSIKFRIIIPILLICRHIYYQITTPIFITIT